MRQWGDRVADMPTVVHVGPYDYTVAEVERVHDDAWAYIEYEPRIITVKTTLAGSAKRVALLHEVVHGCTDIAGLNNKKVSEERFAIGVAPVLLDTLRRNPGLVAFLLDGAGT